jgi:methionyl aminopeptidase
MNGFYGDQAYTFMVGEVDEEIKTLIDVTKECLLKGIQKAKAGNRIGDIGFAVQYHAESHGFGVVRELVGHGIGRSMHESPEVPNFGRRGRGPKLLNGMTLAIEPMINLGTKNVKQMNDGWTIVTADAKPSAHFEHDIAIVNGHAEILTTFDYIEKVLI